MINFAHFHKRTMSTKGQEYIIDYKTLESGTYEFDYHIDKEFFAMFDEPMVQDGDANVHVTMRVTSAGLNIRLGISGTLQVECDRCLELFDMPIDTSYDIVVKYGDKTTPPDEADDVITIGSDDDDLDLRQHIYEYVILSLPARRVHPDGEDGTPGCNPEILGKFSMAADDDEDDYDFDDEDYDDEDLDDEEYDDEDYDDEDFDDEESDEDDLDDEEDDDEDIDDGDNSDEEDAFEGQEMETIEQKLSRDPRWDKLKELLKKV